MTAIYNIVKNITIFLILVNVVMNLFGNKEYRKYVSLFVGMVLILIVVQPILTWLKGEDFLSSKIELSGFAIDNAQWESRIKIAGESGRERILKEYKEQMEEQVAWTLERRRLYLQNIEISIEDDESSSEYGSLTALHVTAGRTKKESKIGDVSIDEIRITEEGDVEEYDAEENLSSELTSEEIRKELCALYRMDWEDVHIRIVN